MQTRRAASFKFSTDPELEGQIRDVVGLYLHPPEKAVALCVDEEPRSKRWNRPRRRSRSGPGSAERQTFDHLRHGTTTLFAALEVATGKVTDACTDRHHHQEFLGSLQQVAAAYPAGSCTWWSTTTPPTTTPRCGPGWPDTDGCSCTSPRPRARV